MTALDVLESIKKHGFTGATVIALFWMNNRLSSVESRLYDCYDDLRHTEIRMPDRKTEPLTHNPKRLLAVLPSDRKIKKSVC